MKRITETTLRGLQRGEWPEDIGESRPGPAAMQLIASLCSDLLDATPPPSAPATTGSAPRYTETCRMSHVHALDCGPQLIVDSPPSIAPPGSAPATVRVDGVLAYTGDGYRDGAECDVFRVEVLNDDRSGCADEFEITAPLDLFSDGDEVRVSVEVVRPAGKEKP